ncbi:MAG: hypothetical protein IT166_13865 [Bryobacterales bacterium]|nr:hypothetical protein [Bryobacterales bacterium]
MRYPPSKKYQYAGVAALVMALFCACFAINWPMAWIPTGLFLATGSLMILLGLMPPIEVHETHLAIGKRVIAWEEIRRLDGTGFVSPLLLNITLSTGGRILLVYPGGLDSSNVLLRHLRRMSKGALIDGVPYYQFWGETPSLASERAAPNPPRYPILLPEDEADVERLYQRLKTVGRLDRSDEK